MARTARRTDTTTRPELSVVIIAYNEEDRIEACLDSVFAACRTVGTFEVILVDSNSTDRTVARASNYPITVLRIRSDSLTTPGAGRYVGTQAARAETMLFVDGDMALTETWLPHALTYLKTHADVAAVEGCLNHSTQTEITEVKELGGFVLCDAGALAEVGGFDPYLRSNEDIDVGLQLTTNGYRLVRLPEVSARHHTEKAIREPLRRWQRGYYLGPGQMIRKWQTTPTVLRYLVRRQRYKLGVLAWVSVGIVSGFISLLFVWWVLLSVVLFSVIAAKIGVRGAATFLFAKSLGAAGLLVGLMQPTPNPETFPLSEVEVVTTGEVLSGADLAAEDHDANKGVDN